uniref:Uncharacterized protein n=1 Tax=Physcomitrium patens TaxID=3218 RepID=A0A2K1KC16_PHYPA|nr:hypothetical protein PHYPA_010504 [Physcomitrium patens]
MVAVMVSGETSLFVNKHTHRQTSMQTNNRTNERTNERMDGRRRCVVECAVGFEQREQRLTMGPSDEAGGTGVMWSKWHGHVSDGVRDVESGSLLGCTLECWLALINWGMMDG